MTTIKITDKKIEVKGHSEYDEKGKDIVCAAISTLTEATYRYLKATGNVVGITAIDGYFFMVIEVINANGQNIVKTFTEMIDDLIQQYPKNIRRID